MIGFLFQEDTLDDLLRAAISEITESGEIVQSSKGPNREITGTTLVLRNPLARLSRTENRGRFLSCLGEMSWYLSASNDPKFISHYIKEYEKYDHEDVSKGAYGPRLYGPPINQVEKVIEILTAKPQSKQAVIQIFQATDLHSMGDNYPCTCTMHFMIRNGQLNMFTTMRSNDAYKGLPHDIFCFTMLQEIVARELNVALGQYCHHVNSLHLYDSDAENSESFLSEGFQEHLPIMMPMPDGNQSENIAQFLAAEKQLRETGDLTKNSFEMLNSYWKDLVYLLVIYKKLAARDLENARTTMDLIANPEFKHYVRDRIDAIINSTSRRKL